MKNTLIIAFLFIFSNVNAQSKIINPIGKWYFGAEIGTNYMSSLQYKGEKSSFQGGITTEYYFARHWSLAGRIKYFETGVSFDYPSTHTGSWLDLGSDAYYGQFKGATIAVPFTIKWEFRVYKNAAASLKCGYAHSFETKSFYNNYTQNLSSNYSKNYGNSVVGFGFNYFIDKKMAVYIDCETYFGGEKAKIPGLIFNNKHYVMNNLFNLGLKYNFKK